MICLDCDNHVNRTRHHLFNFVQREMAAVAFLGLIARSGFAHGGVGRRAAVLSVGFDAVPLDHEYDPSRIFDAGEEFDAVRPGVVGFL